MKVRFKKLSAEAVMPTKAHPTDAGYDLYCSRVEVVKDCYVCHTDVSFEIPEGYVGLVFPRSSIVNKVLSLSNSVGVIDSGYRGEVSMKFKGNLFIREDYSESDIIDFSHYISLHKNSNGMYQVGERCGQIIIMPYPEIEFEEADELSETDRGNGGYGSTGK